MAGKYEIECLRILDYLANNEYTNLDDIVDATDISRDEVRRYLLREVEEKRDWEYIIQCRKHNRNLYAKLIQTLRPCEDDGKVYIDTSKHEYFIKYANKHGYDIIRTDEYPYLVVAKMEWSSVGDDRHHRKRKKNEFSREGPQSPSAGERVPRREWGNPLAENR